MRDFRGAAERHRARFALGRRTVPPVVRVLLAGRAPGVLRTDAHTVLSLRLHLAPLVSGAVRGPAGGPGPAGAVLRTVMARLVDSPAVPVAGLPAADREVVTATRRIDLVRTRDEHRLTRTEQRIPQVIRVVTRTMAAGPGPDTPAAVAGASRPAAPAPASAPGVVAPAPLDLGRITDHVLTAMDDRLTAYAERLGRG